MPSHVYGACNFKHAELKEDIEDVVTYLLKHTISPEAPVMFGIDADDSDDSEEQYYYQYDMLDVHSVKRFMLLIPLGFEGIFSEGFKTTEEKISLKKSLCEEGVFLERPDNYEGDDRIIAALRRKMDGLTVFMCKPPRS